jgi:SAM-dependent methyltransferase
MNEARLYDEHFAKVLPYDWEMAVLSTYLSSVRTVVDVGCGTGRHAVPLAERGVQTLAVDMNKSYIAAARMKLKSKGSDNTDLVIADARRLPLRQGIFESAICMGNVLGDVEAKRRDRMAMIQEMADTVKPGGILLVELVNRYWKPADLLVWLYRYLATTMRRLIGESLEYGDYTEAVRFDHHAARLRFHAFTTREAKHLFGNLGFCVKIEKRAGFFHDWFVLVAKRLDARF